MVRREREFTKSQLDRLKAAKQELDDCFREYEKRRSFRDSLVQGQASSNVPTTSLELPRRQGDIQDIAVKVVRVYVEAAWAWSLGSLDKFRVQLTSDEREILKWISAELDRKVSKEHEGSLDRLAIEQAVHDEVAYRIDKAEREREISLPWDSADGKDTQHAEVTTTTGDKNYPALPATSGTDKPAVHDSPAPKPVGSEPDQKRGGRPPKKLGEETLRILRAWDEKGNPTLTRQVKDDIASQIFSREYDRTKSGSPARGKLLERIRKAIRRYG
jgi:hypothetical protein